jgi:hypothetical protein
MERYAYIIFHEIVEYVKNEVHEDDAENDGRTTAYADSRVVLARTYTIFLANILRLDITDEHRNCLRQTDGCPIGRYQISGFSGITRPLDTPSPIDRKGSSYTGRCVQVRQLDIQTAIGYCIAHYPDTYRQHIESAGIRS